MNDRFDELMYQAGITAQGCWDEMDGYDRDAILNFAELIVKECALLCSDPVLVLQHFGIDSKS